MSISTGAEIFGYSLRVFRQHRALAIYPLLMLAMGLVLFAMLAPLIFHVPRAELWHAWWPAGGDPQAMRQIAQAATHANLRDIYVLPLPWLLAAFLLGKVGATFITYAFCSQAINAMNGGSVFVVRSFGLALNRAEVIIPWGLMAGALGVAIVIVVSYLGAVGLMLVAVLGTSVAMGRISILPSVLFGVPWNVVSLFVIPVMLNEPGRLNPLGYLRISAQMLRRTSGDALVVGVVGPSSVGHWCAGGVAVAAMVTLYFTDQLVFLSWGLLLSYAITCLTHSVNVIYRCGLYIYATEGVVPGAFDAELFERSWVVK